MVIGNHLISGFSPRLNNHLSLPCFYLSPKIKPKMQPSVQKMEMPASTGWLSPLKNKPAIPIAPNNQYLPLKLYPYLELYVILDVGLVIIISFNSYYVSNKELFIFFLNKIKIQTFIF